MEEVILQMTRTAILQKTREILANEKYWAKEKFITQKITEDELFLAYCLIGAMNKAISDNNDLSVNSHQKAQCILLDIIQKKYNNKRYTSLISFNDEEERTHLDIIELLDEGIVKSIAMNHEEAAKENPNV